MLIAMTDESGRLVGAAVSGQADFMKAIRGEPGSAFDRVRRPTVKTVRAAEDPDDLDGLDDHQKIAAAAADGRRMGIEADIAAGRVPMRKSFADVIAELEQLGAPRAPAPLLKSFAPALKAPKIGSVVTAASLAGRGVTLHY